MPRLLLIVLFMLVPVNAFGANIDGFKDIKFGMTVDQVRQLGGFDCRDDWGYDESADGFYCDWNLPSEPYTLFGRQLAYLAVWFDGGRVTQVEIVPITTPEQSIEEISQVFGMPFAFEKSGDGVNAARSYYLWPSGDNKGGVVYTYLQSRWNPPSPRMTFNNEKIFESILRKEKQIQNEREAEQKKKLKLQKKRERLESDVDKPPKLDDY